MNFTSFLNTLAYFVTKYFPEEVDPTLKPIDSAESLDSRNIMYDFIIVGAGSAGCVLANRLSENFKWNVALIEAGDDEDFVTDVPAIRAFDHYMNTKYDWNYTTVQQNYTCFTDGGICSYIRGFVMGGCSTVNNMIHLRGKPSDYDTWEKLGNPGWSYENVLPYFLKLENIAIPELKRSPFHSTGGPVTVTYSRYTSNLMEDFYRTALELGYPRDDSGTSQYGISKAQFSLDGPTRRSMSKAYLDPIRKRKNLRIFKNTMVTKVLFDSERNQATGVTCIANGIEYNLNSSKEVILSAGAINSPKLLMLSGIGPKEDLTKLGIPVYKDLPVGKILMDTPVTLLGYNIDEPSLYYTPEQANRTILEYAKYGRGVLTSPTYNIALFMNSTTDLVDLFLTIAINDHGLTMPYDGNPETNMIIFLFQINPKSVGSLKLKSNNYLDAPLIDPNCFADEYERISMYWGMQQAQMLMKTRVMQKYSPKLLTNLNAENIDVIRNNSAAGLHGCCSAKMGPVEDEFAVVDAELRVYGVHNLRVVDASVFPKIPSGPTSIPTSMVAEKAADLIKNSYI